MDNSKIVNGYKFKWDDEYSIYECKGRVMYNDEHDEMPEPNLWSAAKKLAEKLENDGYKAQPFYSEKGWVEVTVKQ